MSRRALITGITGQDGAYLAELLLSKGYQVAGTYRPSSSLNAWRLQALGIAEHPRLELIPHDLTDFAGTLGLLDQTQPDEVYNLAAQSFVGLSFKQPVATAHVTAMGPLNMLEAIRIRRPSARFYQASSSEMFGGSTGQPQDERTTMAPRSPYAVSKCFAHWATNNYRDAFGLYAVSGILFNHESPLRDLGFVTRKISDAVARISLGRADSFKIGNLDAQRDWGYAKEFADGIWRMLQRDEPENYVLATGQSHSVRDFIEEAFRLAGQPIRWQGSGATERGVDKKSNQVRVEVDPALHRPTDPNNVVGNPALAKEKLGWESRTNLSELCALMLDHDIQRQRSPAQ